MAKTYNTFTNVSTGDVLTATNFNNVLTNIAGYRVPPMCQVYRSSNLTSYTSDANITWNAEAFTNTDSMFTASSTDVTLTTNGLYAVTFNCFVTATATASRVIAKIVVGTDTYAEADLVVVGGGTAALGTIQTYINVTTTSIVRARVAFIGGSAYVVSGNSTPTATASKMTVAWVGQVS